MELFDTTYIKNMKLKNRFFRAATWEGLASAEGRLTSDLFLIYEELAKGGVGTIITGYSYVTKDEKPNPGMMGIYDDMFIDEYKKLTDLVHQHGTNIIMQLAYGGSMSTLKPPSLKIWGPSAVENQRTGITPIEMSKADIRTLVEAFASAALRAKKAGFDGVEIHAAHGYMLSLFLCPYYNRRLDEYGGSLENRGRIILEIVREIRKAVGDEFPIMIKINSEDFMEDGLTSEESIALSKILEQAGIDAIEVSGGNESCLTVRENNLGPIRNKITESKSNESYFADHAAKLAKSVNIPVILTGGNRHYDVMEKLLKETPISYFALSRPLVCEPDLILTWEHGIYKESDCISCSKCFSTYGKRCIFKLGY